MWGIKLFQANTLNQVSSAKGQTNCGGYHPSSQKAVFTMRMHVNYVSGMTHCSMSEGKKKEDAGADSFFHKNRWK